jgi:electron transfer flavoprotein beta subunit
LKILVTVKRVENTETKIKVKPDGSGIVTEGMKYEINPFDLIALEEGLRLKDQHGGEVLVVLIGPPEAQTELRSPALAMGADRLGWRGQNPRRRGRIREARPDPVREAGGRR